MRHPLESMYRLAPRNGPGLTCDDDGVALGPAVLVERIAGPSPTYRCRPREEIERALALAYGSPAPAELRHWHAGLDAAARALQTGDVARAAVIAVQLRLPGLTADSVAKLAADPQPPPARNIPGTDIPDRGIPENARRRPLGPTPNEHADEGIAVGPPDANVDPGIDRPRIPQDKITPGLRPPEESGARKPIRPRLPR